jgi:hypothetical protein
MNDEYIEDDMDQLIGHGEISAIASSSHVIWEYINGTER